jgi:hypothetical protein
VVHRLAPVPRGVDSDLQVFLEPRLACEIRQPARPQTGFELLFVLASDGRH